MKLFFNSDAASNKNLIKGLAIFIAGLSIGIAFGLQWHIHRSHEKQELRLNGYQFVNPLLECEIESNPAEFRELTPFRRKIERIIDEKTRNKAYEYISVYFRDLNNGPWFGINEGADFAPASLLKVPTMIALLKEAEQRPTLLSETIIYDGKQDYNEGETFKPSIQLEAGRAYTLDDLLFRSIAYSDNNANVMIFNAVNKKTLEKTYKDLGVPLPLKDIQEDFMSVHQYASFFRILFNASYLSKEMSEKALIYLSQSQFHDGIVAGVPDNIKTAHKFGERISSVRPEIRQLHDCGIVYYPSHPYLLCIMSRGRDFSELEDIIKEISKNVYEEINLQHRK